MDSKLFRLIRQSNSLTQRELATRIGISKGMIGLIETDRKLVSRRVENKMTEAFGVEYISRCRTFLTKMGGMEDGGKTK